MNFGKCYLMMEWIMCRAFLSKLSTLIVTYMRFSWLPHDEFIWQYLKTTGKIWIVLKSFGSMLTFPLGISGDEWKIGKCYLMYTIIYREWPYHLPQRTRIWDMIVVLFIWACSQSNCYTYSSVMFFECK